MDIYLQITLCIVGSSAAAGAVVHILKKSIIKKIEAEIQSGYDHKLEEFKGEVNKQLSIANNVLGFVSGNNAAFQKERVEAIKIYWSCYLSISKSSEVVRFTDSYLKKEELENLFSSNHDGAKNTIQELTTIEFSMNSSESIHKIEGIKPFLSSELWRLALIIEGFTKRLNFIYHSGLNKKKINHWTKDTPTIQLLGEVLDEAEIMKVLKAELSSVTIALALIDNKVSKEISAILRGEEILNNSVSDALKVSKLLAMSRRPEKINW